MNKNLSLKLKGGRQMQGTLWECNPFTNPNPITDDYVKMATGGQENNRW